MHHNGAHPEKGESFGLSYWMERVLAEVDGARKDLSTDRVHDLRVALRRCRSMAEGIMAVDPYKRWKSLLKEGRQLFKQLGRLRDAQVLEEWIGRLGEAEDPVAEAMHLHLMQSKEDLKEAAVAALMSFDCDKWRGWITQLQQRTRRLPPGCAVFQFRALQAWDEAHQLHKRALRNRSDTAFHRLRIGIKRFRYTVENFLPLLHDEWAHDLKELQDCLGEAHDLSVFWQTALRLNAFPDPESRKRWRALIAGERARCMDRYRAKMIGSDSLWDIWRLGLPSQGKLPSIVLRTVVKWASFHGINLARARHVRRLALQMFDGLRRGTRTEIRNRRFLLHLAAILQEIVRAKGKKSGNQNLLPGLPFVSGFASESLSSAAMIIRGQRRKLPNFEAESDSALSEEQRRLILELSGILRLARVLSRDGERAIHSLKVEQTGNSIVIFAAGYSELSRLAEKAARARYLLEYACQRPVVIRGV